MSNHALAPTAQSSTDIVAVETEILTDYLDAMGLAKKLSPSETKQFLHIAQHFQLNPFKREIYATKYGDGPNAQFSIIVGYEVYLKRAERSGQLDGWNTKFVYDGNGDLYSCIITIFRKDRKFPFEWEVFYDEQVQTTRDNKVTKFWQKGRQQLRKVAISQGFRIAFPDEIGGMPYTSDELSISIQDTTAEVAQESTNVPVVEAKPAPVKETAQAKPAPVKMTKLEAAKEMKANARVKDYTKSIAICKDDSSYDYNEQNIANDELLTREEKAVLIKQSLDVRIMKVTTAEQANNIRERIKKWKGGLGSDFVKELGEALISHATDKKGLQYIDYVFYPAMSPSDEGLNATDEDFEDMEVEETEEVSE